MAHPGEEDQGENYGQALSGWLRRAVQGTAGLVLPRRCLTCGTPVAGDGALCAECWPAVRFLGSTLCAVCGYPLEFDPGAGALCGACTALQPAFDRARSVYVYDSASRGLLLAFKHADRTDAAPSFARLMAHAAVEMLPYATVIVPVPPHRRRLLARRFNQSALLAQAIGRETAIKAIPDFLVRTRHTPSQGGLSATARRRNVTGAFAVCKEIEDSARGARVLMVDDVFTTGATVGACATALRRAGAAAIDVITLARVVWPTLL